MPSPRTSRRRRWAAALAGLGLAAGAASPAGAGGLAPAQRGRGLLLSPYDAITACEVATYRGPETQLYSDRPYHTAGRVAPAVGRAFCRGARHGTQVWVLDVAQPTALLAMAAAGSGLAKRGWTRVDTPLRVEAAGVPFDALFSREVGIGRFVIRQGFAPAAPIVLWDPASARIAPGSHGAPAESSR